MATNVLLPQWGMNMEDGLLVKWLVKEGDTVETGQPLVEIETAKINSELEAPESGVVAHIMASEGATVDVGTLVAVIAEPGESVARPSETHPQKSPTTSKRKPSATSPATRIRGIGGQVTPVARKLARQNNIDIATVQGTGPNGRITEQDVRLVIEAPQRPAAQVVPRARLLAREHDIDLGAVQGSGPNGRILVADVERAVGSQIHAPAGEVVPLKGLRKTIADRMMQSVQTMA